MEVEGDGHSTRYGRITESDIAKDDIVAADSFACRCSVCFKRVENARHVVAVLTLEQLSDRDLDRLVTYLVLSTTLAREPSIGFWNAPREIDSLVLGIVADARTNKRTVTMIKF